LLSQLLGDILGVNELLFFLGLEDCLVNPSDQTDLINFFVSHHGTVFSFFHENVELSFDLVLLLLKLHDLLVVNVDLLLDLKVNLFLVVVEKSLVFLDQAVEFGISVSLNHFYFGLYLHAVNFSIFLHALTVVGLQVFEQTGRTDFDVSNLDGLEPNAPAFYDFKHLFPDLGSKCLSVSQHFVNCRVCNGASDNG
jgi:hypothetical protein